jgi:hypothetical protein
MTSAIDIKPLKNTYNDVGWREQLTSGHFVLDVLNQFPRPARKNGHAVFFSILEQDFCDNYIEPP